MQNFLEYERLDRETRNSVDRILDFDEIYKNIRSKEAKSQSSRCIQCGIPYCSYGCPLGNFIPHWLQNVANKDLDTAFQISNETSPFPEIMGKICPHDKLCEGACTLEPTHGAITIGSIEQYISERGFSKNLKIKNLAPKNNKKVAIIGSGPAGLSAATFLLRHGVNVSVYEKEDRAGGLMVYGIPNFKLDKSSVANRVNMLIENGMELHLNSNINKDNMQKIVDENDAIFLAIGATKAFGAGIENEDKSFKAMEFLVDVQKAHMENKKPSIDISNKDVVVIGGGDTAMDCVRTSIRLNAKSVKCLYRRDEKDMPGSKKEFMNAKNEGVNFHFFVSPEKINLDSAGNTSSISMIKTKIENNKLIYLDDKIEIKADIIIFALGFEVEKSDIFESANILLDDKGRVNANDYKTSNPKIFTGGDCLRGADLVVNAALDGREATNIILKELGIN